jgi:ATP-dependent helicase/nuclease subunit B
LLGFARAGLEELSGSPRVAAFWLPRFERFAEWFAETERMRRDGIAQTLAEIEGALVVEGPAGPFTLTARADRIDVAGGGLVITDYKTAKVDDLAKRAAKGQAPQLPLEAAIAIEGGFTGLPAGPVLGLAYISASGGEPAGDRRPLDGDAGRLAAEARQGLIRLIAAFDDAAAPYRALRRPRFNYRYDDYAHLARVAEWQVESIEEAA